MQRTLLNRKEICRESGVRAFLGAACAFKKSQCGCDINNVKNSIKTASINYFKEFETTDEQRLDD